MRYQVAALLTGLVTVLALAGAATFVWLSVGAADDDRRQIAAESEIEAVQAALDQKQQALGVGLRIGQGDQLGQRFVDRLWP